MALGLSGSFGARAAQEALRLLTADRIKEEQRGIENSQMDRRLADMEADTGISRERLGIDLQGLDVDRQRLALQLRPRITTQSGLVGPGGQKQFAGVNEDTGDTVWTKDEFVAPVKPEASSDFEAWTKLPPEEQQRVLGLRKQWEDANNPPQRTGPQQLSPNQELLAISRLQKQWDSATQNYSELNRQAQNMDIGLNAARRGDLAAGSQAVLVTFQKILDPTSVVRESEYARSAAGQSVLIRIQGAIERLTSGGAGVPVNELEKFSSLAKEFVRASESGLRGRRARLEQTAKSYNLDPSLIFDSAIGTEQPPQTPTTLMPMSPVSSHGPATGQAPAANPLKVIRYDANGNIIR